MKGIRNGLIVVAALSLALIVISGRALVVHGYEAQIGRPMFHFPALFAFPIACVVGGGAAVALAVMVVVKVVRNRRGAGAEQANPAYRR